MARVDNITIFLVVVIVAYTTLAGGITATYAGLTYEGDDNSIDIYDVLNYADTETMNLSRPAVPFFPETAYYTGLSPERSANWRLEIISEAFFYVEAKGIGFPANLIFNNLEPEGLEPNSFGTLSGVSESYVIDNYDTDKNYTHVVFNKGGQLETHALISPQFNYNGTYITYMYDNMTDAINNGEVTITLGVNASYIDAFDVNKIMGNIVGFGAIYNEMPTEVNIFVSGIWWALIILLGVKLVVG